MKKVRINLAKLSAKDRKNILKNNIANKKITACSEADFYKIISLISSIHAIFHYCNVLERIANEKKDERLLDISGFIRELVKSSFNKANNLKSSIEKQIPNIETTEINGA